MGVRVSNCCFCIKLRTASLIFGYLGSIGSAIGFIMLLIASIALGTVTSYSAQDMEKFRAKLTPEQYQALEEALAAAPAVLILSILMMIVLAINFVFYVALLMGVYQKKPSYVKAFTVFTLVFIVVSVVYIITNTLLSDEKVKTIIYNLINLAWSIYTWIVVRSYYHELKEEVEGRGVAATNMNKYP